MWNQPSTWVAIFASIVFTVMTWVFIAGKKAQALSQINEALAAAKKNAEDALARLERQAFENMNRIEKQVTENTARLDKIVSDCKSSEASARETLRAEMRSEVAQAMLRLESYRSEFSARIDTEREVNKNDRHDFRDEVFDKEKEFWKQLTERLNPLEVRVLQLERKGR